MYDRRKVALVASVGLWVVSGLLALQAWLHLDSVLLLYGLVAAVLYALLYSALGLLIAAATPRRGFGVAAIMGVLMISFAVANITYALNGGFDPTQTSSSWAFLISPSALVEALVNQLFGLEADSPSALHAPGGAGTAVFTIGDSELQVSLAGAFDA